MLEVRAFAVAWPETLQALQCAAETGVTLMARRRRYRCILADPAWPFKDQGSRIAPAHAGHYDVMSLSAIIGLGDWVRHQAANDAHLWLAAPNALVLDGTAADVAQYWGFQVKQQLTWVKHKLGMGHWMRNTTEQVLFCVRGRLAPRQRNVPTHFHGKVTRHSAKPDELYELIERISPAPRLEMFARRARRHWWSWGNEAPAETAIDLDLTTHSNVDFIRLTYSTTSACEGRGT